MMKKKELTEIQKQIFEIFDTAYNKGIGSDVRAFLKLVGSPSAFVP